METFNPTADMIRGQRTVDDWLANTQEYAIGSFVIEHYSVGVGSLTPYTLGRELREWRRANGYTQQDVANSFGWSRQKVSDIECGVVEAGFIDICRLCDLYQCTPFDVMGVLR